MCEILNSYQGIIGTVIGAFLGWFLSQLNRIGKLSFFANNFNLEYYEQDKGGAICKGNLNDKTMYGIFSFDLDVINTASNNRMLRKIHCLFNYSNNKLTKEIDDIESERIVAQRVDYDKFEIMNIQSKSVVKKKLSIYLSKDDLLKGITDKAKISLVFTKLWGIKRERTIYITSLLNGKIRQ